MRCQRARLLAGGYNCLELTALRRCAQRATARGESSRRTTGLALTFSCDCITLAHLQHDTHETRYRSARARRMRDTCRFPLRRRESAVTTRRMSDGVVTDPPGTLLRVRPFSNRSRYPEAPRRTYSAAPKRTVSRTRPRRRPERFQRRPGESDRAELAPRRDVTRHRAPLNDPGVQSAVASEPSLRRVPGTH